MVPLRLEGPTEQANRHRRPCRKVLRRRFDADALIVTDLTQVCEERFIGICVRRARKNAAVPIGHVQRCAQVKRGKDRRERLFSLTEAGRRQIAEAQPYWEPRAGRSTSQARSRNGALQSGRATERGTRALLPPCAATTRARRFNRRERDARPSVQSRSQSNDRSDTP